MTVPKLRGSCDTNQTSSLIFFHSVTFELKDQSIEIKIEKAIKNVFDGICNQELLLGIIHTVQKQKHGTTLIINNKAAEESKRLAGFNRAILIDPVEISNDNILSLTSIDGALMIKPDGMCYSIGAILDGVAHEKGNTSRGARYNSAITYVKQRENEGLKEGEKVLAIIISADESTDVFPETKTEKIVMEEQTVYTGEGEALQQENSPDYDNVEHKTWIDMLSVFNS